MDKYGLDHYRRIGKLGGRPPIPIIQSETATSKEREVMPTPGNLLKLKALWRSHPLYHIHCDISKEVVMTLESLLPTARELFLLCLLFVVIVLLAYSIHRVRVANRYLRQVKREQSKQPPK